MSVQKCRFETRVVAMSDRDGLEIAARWFDLTPEQVEAQCGRFARGQHKGNLRGWIVYRKCVEGGWSYGVHGVIRPAMIFAAFCSTFDEMEIARSSTFGEFCPMAQRVDSAYGYDRKADAARRQAECEAQEKRRRMEQEGRARVAYHDACDLFAEANGRQPTKEEKAELQRAAYAEYQLA